MSEITNEELIATARTSQSVKVAAFVLQKVPNDIVAGAVAGVLMSLGTNIMAAVVTGSAPPIFAISSLLWVAAAILCFPLLILRNSAIDDYEKTLLGGIRNDQSSREFNEICTSGKGRQLYKYSRAILVLTALALIASILFYWLFVARNVVDKSLCGYCHIP